MGTNGPQAKSQGTPGIACGLSAAPKAGRGGGGGMRQEVQNHIEAAQSDAIQRSGLINPENGTGALSVEPQASTEP